MLTDFHDKKLRLRTAVLNMTMLVRKCRGAPIDQATAGILEDGLIQTGFELSDVFGEYDARQAAAEASMERFANKLRRVTELLERFRPEPADEMPRDPMTGPVYIPDEFRRRAPTADMAGPSNVVPFRRKGGAS